MASQPPFAPNSLEGWGDKVTTTKKTTGRCRNKKQNEKKRNESPHELQYTTETSFEDVILKIMLAMLKVKI